ncbi:hypothetical protein ACOMHN_039721 [Nucella lapillus]
MASETGRKILIAMDGSKHAEYAFRYYKENLHREGDDVIVVYAVEYGSLVAQPVMTTDPQFCAHVAEEEDKEVQTLMNKLTALMTEVGLKGRVQRVSANRPGEAVVKVATEQHVNLIVTGTRGMGMLRRTLMGSVSQYIVHHAHMPVLVCRQK